MREIWTILGVGIVIVGVVLNGQWRIDDNIRHLGSEVAEVKERLVVLELKVGRIEAIIERVHPPYMAATEVEPGRAPDAKSP